MAEIYNDAGIEYGSLNITVNGQRFVIERMEISRPTHTIKHTVGRGNRMRELRVDVEGFVTGSFQIGLRWKRNQRVRPNLHSRFTLDFGCAFGKERFVTTCVWPDEMITYKDKRMTKKRMVCRVDFAKIYNQ